MRYGELLVLLGSLSLAAALARSGYPLSAAITSTTGVLAGLRILSDPVRATIDDDIGLVCGVLLFLHGIAILEIASVFVFA